MAHKYVYYFGDGQADGDASQRALLGGKGANLQEMVKIGLPVPAGFTITTEVCTYFYDHGRQYPPELKDQVQDALSRTEKSMGMKFGDSTNPLLLACRSGGRDSMPGMMDTVLNIGLNDTTVQALAKASGNEAFALDSYRRLLFMYGEVVMGLKGHAEEPFEHILHEAKKARGVKMDNELTPEDLRKVITGYKAAILKYTGKEFPQDPREQIWNAIGAVFGSWMNDRAIVYRRQYGIPDEWGTACNVMAMVFGNLGNDCATGVALTRDGSLGTPGINGDYLINAQGEDVVNGSRPTKRIEDTLKADMPKAYDELVAVATRLEKHYRNMQDIEFTIQRNKLFMLQTRNAKRTGFAAVRVATDLVAEGLISKEEAISAKFIPAGDIEQVLKPIFDAEAKKAAVREGQLLTKGTQAGPGAATGKIVLTPQKAEALKNADKTGKLALILVRKETTPEDLRGMKAALGILTAVGGVSSHAALVSRQMGKVCIVGAGELDIDEDAGTVTVKNKVLKEGDDISIDGFTGEVFSGSIPTKPSEVERVLITKDLKADESDMYRRFEQVMKWADEHRKLRVRTNADVPIDAEKAIAFGAEGIGLCRTEHMFFDHITDFRRMILAREDPEKQAARHKANVPSVFQTGDYFGLIELDRELQVGTEKRKLPVREPVITSREQALTALLRFQREDFFGLFKAMAGKPVTIRLLDPPLHEFLPNTRKGQEEAAAALHISVEEVARRVEELHEANPMLGHRGCRLGIVYPEITAMQARAIFEAAIQAKKAGVVVLPEVMIPLVGFVKEYENQAAIVHAVAKKVFAETNDSIEYQVGTMIEIPRACIAAGDIAKTAQFFSFGTNDLTQTTLGISRDDYTPFISVYNDPKKADIIPSDPFATIDQDGVGKLMEMGVKGGRGTREKLKIGICGEHGGDPASVVFCHKIKLDYVSCSPYRVPVARLAAAQAAMEEKK